MEIRIGKQQLVTAAGAAIVSLCGWFTLETYNQAQRISALEQNVSTNERQDRELQEIRDSVQDLIVLFFQESQEVYGNSEQPAFVPEYPNAAPDDGFSAAQTDLKHLIELHDGRRR